MHHRFAATALCLVLAAGSAAHGAERRYRMIMPSTGLNVGALTIEATDATHRNVAYRFSNNGRGPNLTSSVELDAAGAPKALTVRGVDVLQVPVTEDLTSSPTARAWTSTVDKGSGAAGGYYFPYYDSPEDKAILVRALLKAKDRRLAILPGGEARVESGGVLTVSNGQARQKVELFIIHGLGLGPSAVWLDEQHELFASLGGPSAILEGWDAVLPQLEAVQDKARAAGALQLGKDALQRPDTPVLFRNVRLFDAQAMIMREGMSVLVEGRIIAKVGPQGSIGAPKGAKVVDGAGKTLLPGLWDIHVHLGDELDGAMNLIAGVTSVRDMGGEMESKLALRRRFDSGELAGPHMVLAGLIDGRAPTASNSGVLISTQAEAAAAIETFRQNKYDEIKLYSSFPAALVPAAVPQSHAAGMKIGGHVPVNMRLNDVLNAHWDGVSHMNFVLLNLLDDEVQKKTNTLARMLEPAEQTRRFAIDDPAVRDTIARFKASGAAFDPTIIVLEGLFTAKSGDLRPYAAAYGDRLPASVLRGARSGGLAKDEAQRLRFTESYLRSLDILKGLNDAGVPMGPGTDGTAGILLPHELEIWVQAGIAPTKVLYDATLGSAKIARRDGQTGSITEGKQADLILVEGDPSKDIGAVRRLDMVMKSGAFYDLGRLGAAVGVRPYR